MKLLTVALTLFTLSLPLTSSAFSLKALMGDDSSESQSSFDFEKVKSTLEKAFNNADPKTKSLLENSLKQFVDTKDIPFLKSFQNLKSAELTNSQKAILDSVKNDLMAAVVERNFAMENTKNNVFLQSALDSIRSGNLEGVSNSFDSLKSATRLTRDQKAIINLVQDNLQPILSTSINSLKNAFSKD